MTGQLTLCRNVIILEQVTINSCTITYKPAPVQVRLVEIFESLVWFLPGRGDTGGCDLQQGLQRADGDGLPAWLRWLRR